VGGDGSKIKGEKNKFPYGGTKNVRNGGARPATVGKRGAIKVKRKGEMWEMPGCQRAKEGRVILKVL